MGVCMSNAAAGHGNNVLPAKDGGDDQSLRPGTPDKDSDLGTGLLKGGGGAHGGRKAGGGALPESLQATHESVTSSSRRGGRGGSSGALPALPLAGDGTRVGTLEALVSSLQRQLAESQEETRALARRLETLATGQAAQGAELQQMHSTHATALAAAQARSSARDQDLDFGYGGSGRSGDGAGGHKAAEAAAAGALLAAQSAAARAAALEAQMGDVQQRLCFLETNVSQVKDTVDGQRAAQEFAKQLQRVQESGMLPARVTGNSSRGHSPHPPHAANMAAWMEPADSGAADLLPAPVGFPKLKPARERRRMDGGGGGGGPGGHGGGSAVDAAGFASGGHPARRGPPAGRRAGAPRPAGVAGSAAAAGAAAAAVATSAGWKSGPAQYPGAAVGAKRGGPQSAGGAAVPPMGGAAGAAEPLLGGGQGQQQRLPLGQGVDPPLPVMPRPVSPVHVSVQPAGAAAAGGGGGGLGTPPHQQRVESVMRLEAGGGGGGGNSGMASPSWMGGGDRSGHGGGGKAGERVESAIRLEAGIQSPSWLGGGGDQASASERAAASRADSLIRSEAPGGGGIPSPISHRAGGGGGGGDGARGGFGGNSGASSFAHRSGGGGAGGGWENVGGAGGGVDLMERPSAPERSGPSSRVGARVIEVRPASHSEYVTRSPAPPLRSQHTGELNGGMGGSNGGGGGGGSYGGGGVDSPEAFGERAAAGVLSAATRMLSNGNINNGNGSGGGFGGNEGSTDRFLQRTPSGMGGSVLPRAAGVSGGGGEGTSGGGAGGFGSGFAHLSGGGLGGHAGGDAGDGGGGGGAGDDRERGSGGAGGGMARLDSDPSIEMSGRLFGEQFRGGPNGGGGSKQEMNAVQRYDNVMPSDLLLAHHMRQGRGPSIAQGMLNGSGPKQFL